MVYSSENDSDHETRKQSDDRDNSDIQSKYENETRRKEGQETSVEEEEDISETENGIDKNGSSTLQENVTETNVEDITLVRETPKRLGSVDTNAREDGEEDVLVHLEGSIPEAEHRSKELSNTKDRGECKSVKEKIAEAIEKDHLVSSEPEDSDSSTEDEDSIIVQDKHEDGASLAEELKTLKSQKATVEMEQDKQMVGKERTLEKDKILAEDGLKEAALEEELLSKNVAALIAKQEVKNEPQKEQTELEGAAIVKLGLEMGNAEKDIICEEGTSYEGKLQVEEPKEAIFGDKACKRKEIVENYPLEMEEVEGQKFSGRLMANKEAFDGEEVADDLGEGAETLELVGGKALEKEACRVKEAVEETIEVDVVMGTAFVTRDTVEAASGGYETQKKSGYEEEPGEKANIIENGIIEDKCLKGDEYVKVELKSDSIMKAQQLATELKDVDIVTLDKEATISEESVPGENGLVGEVASDQEEPEEEGEEISQEGSKMKILSTNEDIALEKLGMCMEEPSLDWETERSISLTEEKNRKSRQAIVTTKREEKADKPNAEKEPTVKGRQLVKESIQEEEKILQAVEEEAEEELVDQMPKSKVASLERKLVAKKEEHFTKDTIEPKSIALVAEEILMTTQPKGKVDTEEIEKEGEVVTEGKVKGGEGVLILQEEAEEAEADIEAESNREVEAEEAEMKREMVNKGEVEAEDTKVGKEASVKEKVDSEEAEAGKKMRLKENVGDEEPQMEREMVVKMKMDADEAEEKVVITGKEEAKHLEAKREVLSTDARSKGEIVSEVSTDRGQSIEAVTETKQISGSSAQKVVLGATGGNEEKRKSNEPRFQNKVKIPTEGTLRNTSIDALLQKEVVPVEDEEEAEETGKKEEKLREEKIPVKFADEALLFGTQNLITEVSHINVEATKDGFEDSTQEMSSHENNAREDVFVGVVEERQVSQSDSSEERKTKEFVEVINLEKKVRSGKSQIKQEEFPTANLPETERFPTNMQHSESEQQCDITAQMIYLEAHTSSALDDRN